MEYNIVLERFGIGVGNWRRRRNGNDENVGGTEEHERKRMVEFKRIIVEGNG